MAAKLWVQVAAKLLTLFLCHITWFCNGDVVQAVGGGDAKVILVSRSYCADGEAHGLTRANLILDATEASLRPDADWITGED